MRAGATGLIAPTRYLEKPIEEFEVDGVRMIFQSTPNTEEPREMNTYIPDMKALGMAEFSHRYTTYTLCAARRCAMRQAPLHANNKPPRNSAPP